MTSTLPSAVPGTRAGPSRGTPQPACPLRPGDECTLCQVSTSGPQDCGLVYLVMSDPDLRDRLRIHTSGMQRST